MYRYDNLQAFDGNPIEIEFETDGKAVSKALFVINNGVIVREFTNPVSPLYVELDEADTGKLQSINVGNLILFDSEGRKKTCDGELRFTTEKEVYLESQV